MMNSSRFFALGIASGIALASTTSHADPTAAPESQPLPPSAATPAQPAPQASVAAPAIAPTAAPAPAPAAAPTPAPAPTVAATPDVPKADEELDPFTFADFTWQSGNARTKDSLLTTKYFTGEFRLDDAFHYSFNHPSDDTIVGSTEAWRSGENQVAQLGIGGDFHMDNVQGRYAPISVC